ncbi:MAG: hypothetical protein V2A34_02190 [Lentisphaerota bacterium]
MSDSKSIDIICSQCGADTFILRKPKYDGFKKIGETPACSACGFEYPGEEAVPFKNRPQLKIFTEADRSAQVKVFREDEKGKICRYCGNYVVNPFMQWCSAHKKEVEATDTCNRFVLKKEPEPPPAEPKKTQPSLK